MSIQSDWAFEVEPARPAQEGALAAGPVYRSTGARDGPPALEGASTCYELFHRSVELYPSRPCLGSRKVVDGQAQGFTYMTYAEAGTQVRNIGSAMQAVGVKPHHRAGVFGANSPEWMIALQACNRQSTYCVPLYDSLGEDAIEYIVDHASCSIVFVSTLKFPGLVEALPRLKHTVKTVVYWGPPDQISVQGTEALGMTVFSFEAFAQLGSERPCPANPPQPEDLCTIMYTSGTTDKPKGVELSHRAVVRTVAGVHKYLQLVGYEMDCNDSQISYLPLAHIFDRTSEELLLYIGAKIGYWRGDIKGLVDDIGEMKPTLFIGVPRVFDRIYAGVYAKVNGGGAVKRFLFNYGYRWKLSYLLKGFAHHQASPFFDKLVFSKIKARLGGHVRLIVTGGAPLANHVEEFLKVCFCCPVVQGFGLTETCAASCIAVPDKIYMAGTVGPPLPSTDMRLEAVPEMNYDPTGNPPRGEIMFKGPSVFSGYYKDEEKTTEVLDKHGWFHTGDIGEMTPEGSLKIIDRKKNIFKLAQGEYVAAEKIEAAYKKSRLVEQIWVYGNSLESTLVAVVVPTAEGGPLQEWASQKGLPHDLPSICRNDEARKWVLDQLTATAKESKLKGFEMIKSLYLDPEQFTVENGLMTPTFKLKRPPLQAKYTPQIDAMYKKINSSK
ncbi:hypothetical protein ABBQ32_009626 [Trebouxia sp. C0010 RCD-2024]